MTTLIQHDARNRALRSLMQGLAFDTTAAIVLVLFTTFSAAESFGDLEWTIIAFSVGKSAVVSALSYLMRTVFDRNVSDVVAPPAKSGE